MVKPRIPATVVADPVTVQYGSGCKTVQTAIRLPVDLVRDIDERASKLSAVSGIPVTRAQFIRMALVKHLHPREPF